MFKLQQSKRPSLSPYNSAMKLLVEPICLVKPATHSPCSSCTIPPQPDLSDPSKHDPSVFSFFQPAGGISQRKLLMVLQFGFLGESTQQINSETWFIISFGRFWFSVFLLKTTIFRLFHIHHLAKEKVIFQGGFPWARLLLVFPLRLIQSWSLLIQNSWLYMLTPN